MQPTDLGRRQAEDVLEHLVGVRAEERALAGGTGGASGIRIGDAGVSSSPIPGWFTVPNTGFFVDARQSSSRICVNVWYGPQHTPCSSSAARIASSDRASNHGASNAAIASRHR